MATNTKEDARAGVNPQPVPRPGSRELKKPTYEFKLTRVREAGRSRKIDCPEGAFDYWNSIVATSGWFQETREHLVVVLLNTRHNVEGHNLVTVGTLTETLGDPRGIFMPVLCGAAFGFILMHNHPSGDPTPSSSDRALTRQINEGAALLKIEFIDHIIAGREGGGGDEPFFSFKEMGLL